MIQYHDFQRLLYQKFIGTKQHDPKVAAERMAVTLSTLYKWIEGKNGFPPDKIADLYNATGDLDFLNFFLDDTDQMLTPRHGGQPAVKSVERESLEVGSAVGKFMDTVDRCLEDGRLNEKEKRAIEQSINDAEKEFEDVRAKLRPTNDHGEALQR